MLKLGVLNLTNNGGSMARIELKAYSNSTAVPISTKAAVKSPPHDLFLSPKAFIPAVALSLFAVASGSAALQGTGGGQVAQAPDKPTVLQAEYGSEDQDSLVTANNSSDQTVNNDVSSRRTVKPAAVGSDTPTSATPTATPANNNQSSPLEATIDGVIATAARLAPL